MKAKRVLLIVVIVGAGVQLYRPAKTNPPENSARTLRSNTEMPPEVEQTIDRSCSDCHTYRTVWPKYSYVAPVSWLVTDDVNSGRRHVNFSEWSTYSREKQSRRLGDICEQVKAGDMPLWQYTWMHKGTRLSQEQRDAICAWTKVEQQRIAGRAGFSNAK